MGDRASRMITITAGAVIVGLTAVAFWLSYAHLHAVAAGYGLGVSPARSWAWPATLDLFVVAGELLMLRAALTHTVDPWAIGLTVAGSGGSIALNIAGVGAHAQPLAYVVAAVPPTAALLAFGALMRQVHGLLAHPVDTEVHTPVRMVDTPARTPDAQVFTPVSTPVADPAPQIESPQVNAAVHLVDTEDAHVSTPVSTPATDTAPVAESAQPRAQVDTLVDTPVRTVDTPDAHTDDRLSTEAARAAIEQGWRAGWSVRDTATAATRAPSYVQRRFNELRQNDAQPTPGQTEIEVAA